MGLINRFIKPRFKSLTTKCRLRLGGRNHIQGSDSFYIRRVGVVSIDHDMPVRNGVTFRVDEGACTSLGSGAFVKDGCEFSYPRGYIAGSEVMFDYSIIPCDHDHDYRKRLFAQEQDSLLRRYP